MIVDLDEKQIQLILQMLNFKSKDTNVRRRRSRTKQSSSKTVRNSTKIQTKMIWFFILSIVVATTFVLASLIWILKNKDGSRY